MSTKEFNWYKVDNQGKIFPEVYGKHEPHIFRIQIALEETVEPDILQEAVTNMLERYPMFKVRMKRGLFWLYLEENVRPFKIEKMPYEICKLMDFHAQNEYLFRVFYHNNLIAVEIFHSLTDGTGLSEFVKSITYEYLRLKGYPVTPDNLVRTAKEKPVLDEAEDASKMYYDKGNKRRVKEIKALKLTGTIIPDHNIKLISGIMRTPEVLQLAKQNGVTATQYIVSVMMYSIYKIKLKYRTHLKHNQHPVKIGVPVNLRRRFPSRTLRNFVNIVNIEMNMNKEDIELEDILPIVKQQLEEKTTQEELLRKMSEFVSYEKNILIRLVPSIMKKYIMRMAYSFMGASLATMSLSNVGKVEFPDSMKPYIKDLTFLIAASSSNATNVGIITCKDRFKITFSSSIIETDLQKEFFRHFTDLGLSVEIESNYMEENL